MSAPTNVVTERQLEVLKLLAEGFTPAEVGKRLYLAETTVRSYEKRIEDKLNAVNRTHLITQAFRQGLIQ